MHFVTVVSSREEEDQATFMIDSLHSFGGELRESCVWIFCPGAYVPQTFSSLKNVEVWPLEMEIPYRHYDLADKVFACARAEEMLDAQPGSLAWINLDCLFVNPPLLFDLGPAFDAALRPVHLRNVGSTVGEPLDEYWKTIYDCIGVEAGVWTVESFVDGQTIRPYFNTHCFSINPAKGILQAWRKYFQALVSDCAFQAGPCQDELHRVFLHQVVLSALIMKSLDRDRILMLPPEYSYPLHLQQMIPPSRQFKSLNSTVCTVYEEADVLAGIEVADPLRSWLMEHR